MDALLRQALDSFPELAATLNAIRQVRQEAENLPYEEFFETPSAFDLSGKSPSMMPLSLPTVLAWTKHIAHGSRARMLSLESAIIRAIVNGQLTPAVVLLRSHAETAGLPCLALLTLRAGDVKRLRDVVQRTWFGSSLAKGWRAIGGDLGSFAPTVEGHPPSAGELMKALDSFVDAGGQGNSRYQGAYGILCEFAHPNNRGVLGFLGSREVPGGWLNRYSPTEEVRQGDRVMVTSLLLEMMRLGHSAAEFLRLGTVRSHDEGFTITPPSSREMHQILTALMLLDDQANA